MPRGETGEVCARAGNFMREYWNKPEATDRGVRAAAGTTPATPATSTTADYLFLVDRVKDMIVTGGENVYSAEVESAISKHHAVEQVAVIGIPHDTWGEQVHAIVVLAEATSATDDRAEGVRQGPDRRLQGAQVGRVPGRAAAAVGGDEGPQA